MPADLENSAVATGLEKVSFQLMIPSQVFTVAVLVVMLCMIIGGVRL